MLSIFLGQRTLLCVPLRQGSCGCVPDVVHLYLDTALDVGRAQLFKEITDRLAGPYSVGTYWSISQYLTDVNVTDVFPVAISAQALGLVDPVR